MRVAQQRPPVAPQLTALEKIKLEQKAEYDKHMQGLEMLQEMMAPEVKWYNTQIGAVAITQNSSTIYPLNGGITQGVGQSQRVGDLVQNKELLIRLDVTRVAVDSIVRVIVFWCKDGASPTGSDLLENAFSYLSPLNKNQSMTYWVEYDDSFTLLAQEKSIQLRHIYRKLRCKTQFESALTTINQNQLNIMFISNQSTVANQPTVNMISRITYTDL